MNAYELPTTIDANGQVLHIRNDGDWRMVIDVNIALGDLELNEQERLEAALLIFYDIPLQDIKDINSAIQGMYEFIAAGTEDEEIKAPQKPKLIDWEYDGAIIISGINSVIGKEVRALRYMHWWTFISAYMGIGESTLSTVVSIRNKIARGKKLEKYEQDFRRDNPQYFRQNRRADKAGHDALLELWGENE